MPIQYSGLVQAFTKDECLDAIRQYEAVCKQQAIHASRHGYQRWHKQEPNTPSIGPIEKFGTWNEMRRQAQAAGEGLDGAAGLHGANSNNSIWTKPEYRWTKTDCLNALKLYSDECSNAGVKRTLLGYTKWSTGRQDVPSSVTVIKHLGREEAKLRVQGQEHEPPAPRAPIRHNLKPRF